MSYKRQKDTLINYSFQWMSSKTRRERIYYLSKEFLDKLLQTLVLLYIPDVHLKRKKENKNLPKVFELGFWNLLARNCFFISINIDVFWDQKKTIITFININKIIKSLSVNKIKEPDCISAKFVKMSANVIVI